MNLMKFLLGTKLEMTQIFDENGKVAPITLIEAGPVVITQIKTKDKDGYDAVQIGYGHKKKLTKPLKGHLKDRGSFRWLREYRVAPNADKAGDKFDVSVFSEGDKVTLSGVSKGKGFQGVVKRHGFHGMPKTHGTKKKHRSPGSIGSRFPQHVRKGKRMAGRMGSDRTTRRDVRIVKIDKENNLIAVKGAVPGARGTLVEIRG
ncbi:MAG: 50S ribosomal protein L3 [Candidatus Spechtbacterales bacterium]